MKECTDKHVRMCLFLYMTVFPFTIVDSRRKSLQKAIETVLINIVSTGIHSSAEERVYAIKNRLYKQLK